MISFGTISYLLLSCKMLFYMRPFASTGPLVKMIVKIAIDIRWVRVILALALTKPSP